MSVDYAETKGNMPKGSIAFVTAMYGPGEIEAAELGLAYLGTKTKAAMTGIYAAATAPSGLTLGESAWGSPLRSSAESELRLRGGFPLAPRPTELVITRSDTRRVLARAAQVGAGDRGHNFPLLLDELIFSGSRSYRPGLGRAGTMTYSVEASIGAREGFYEIGVIEDIWSERVIHRSFAKR
jgi:hypothetical protein